MVNAVTDCIFCNLIKSHTLGIGILELEQLLNMPGNSFPFAVRVSCEKDKITCLCCFPQLRDQLVLSFNRDVFRLKIMFQDNPHRLTGQIP